MPLPHAVAGPNGCGKSTLTRTPRLSGSAIIDPDAIAHRTPVSPVQAAREAVPRRCAMLRAGRTHAVEPPGPVPAFSDTWGVARTSGYRIEPYDMSVESADQALDRIRTRVALGGHSVPETDARRRFARSLANLPAVIARVDGTRLFDSTEPDRPTRKWPCSKEWRVGPQSFVRAGWQRSPQVCRNSSLVTDS